MCSMHGRFIGQVGNPEAQLFGNFGKQLLSCHWKSKKVHVGAESNL
ncbi:MAG: hypothetical protein ACLFT3_11660 [Cyclobacteriaceae bacterium]